jgi:tRNA modification GTPase
MHLDNQQDSISAVATAPGRGGIGVIRISGPLASKLADQLLDKRPAPRVAQYGSFYDANGNQLDQGIGIFFPGPNSFTGEDVLELQAHGGPVVLDMLLQATLDLGCRLARPGEFSERAFLNDKIDLAQAEAVSDLINAASEQAARCALRSLQGEFSIRIQQLLDQLIQLRVYVEAAIDFPEEEVDFLSDGKIQSALEGLLQGLQAIRLSAQQGALLREGMKVVILGRPNAGKSSLLNALAGAERAIVTDIPGTTRDLLSEEIQIEGLPLHIVDTAGLRDAPDQVEKIGIQRAWEQLQQADRVLLMQDASELPEDRTDSDVRSFLQTLWAEQLDRTIDSEQASQGSVILEDLISRKRITLIRNKADLVGAATGLNDTGEFPVVTLSARYQGGVDALRDHLKAVVGYQAASEGGFLARRRHLDALERANQTLEQGQQQLELHQAGELLAEDLKSAQNALGEITGAFTADDLLGEIFGSFCIGK